MDPNSTEYYGQEEQSTGDKLKSGIIDLIEFIAIVAAVLIVLRFFVAEPHKVSGSSMVPNFHDGDYIITNKVALKTSQPKRGEVIILQNPRNTDQVFIKRVIGLPGEKVKISGGHVYIDGEVLDEPYLPQGLATHGESFLSEGEEISVPEGQYFVIGDNRGGSSDSREWGPVNFPLIIGQAWLRYWPIQKFGLIQLGKPSA